jgi:hypothetical protein
MSKSVELDNGLVYEPVELTTINQPGRFNFADRVLLRFAHAKWNYSKDSREYQPADLDDEIDLEEFSGAFDKLRVIFACTKKGVFKDVGELEEILKTDSKQIEALYNAALEANPTLKADEELEPGKPDPKGE